MIADSIELVAIGHSLDALVLIVGCDKTSPGAAMALARLNIPGLLLFSGTIAPGKFRGVDVTIQDVFEAVGAHAAGKMSDADLLELESVALQGRVRVAGSSRQTRCRQPSSSWASAPQAPRRTSGPSHKEGRIFRGG